MKDTKLDVGDLVSISNFNTSELDYLRGVNEFEGEIIGIKDDNIELEIIHPNLNLEDIDFIKLKTLLTLSFKKNDGLYQLPVEVDGFKGATVLIVIKAGSLNKIQRRKAIRIPIREEIDYRISPEEEFKSGTLKDVSFIGAKIELTNLKGVSSGINLDLRLNLPCFKENLILKGRVIRIETGSKDNIYNLGVQFINLSNDIRQRLARWILEEQV